MDVEAVARGLVSRWLIDQVQSRGAVPLIAALVAAAIGLLGAVAASGALRVLAVLLLVLALVAVAVIWLARRSAVWAIHRFAEPADLSGHRAAFDAAIERAALPTGPIAIVRFLARLRKGAGAEVSRLQDVVNDLVATVRSAEGESGPPPTA